MRLLVTGAAGFIGRNLCRVLEATGHEVTPYDLANGRDIRNAEMLEAATRGHDAVVHLAAVSGVAAAFANPQAAAWVNAIGSLNVVEAARNAGAYLVAASTAGAIAGAQSGPVTGATPARPLSPYGASKAAMEAFLAGSGALYAALRLTNVYGERSERKANAVPNFCRALRDGTPITIYGDGGQARDYVYVGDVMEAIRLALKERPAGTYAIGTGEATRLNDLAARLSAVAGRETRIEYAPGRPGEVRECWVDPADAAAFGFRASTALDEGLARTWHWFARQ